MLARTMCFAVVTAVALTACSGSTTKTSASTSPAPTTTSTTVPLPDMRLRVLTLHDLPAGWTVNDFATGTGSFSCFAHLRKPPLGELARSEVSYRRGIKGPPGVAEAAGFFRLAPAIASYNALVNAFDRCQNLAIVENGVRVAGTIRALTVRAVGDVSRAWQIRLPTHADGVAATIEQDVIVFRVASYDGELIESDVGTPDVIEFQSLAAIAASRFRGSTA
jgi:hypothetical protein